jgi:hypothetical protein
MVVDFEFDFETFFLGNGQHRELFMKIWWIFESI